MQVYNQAMQLKRRWGTLHAQKRKLEIERKWWVSPCMPWLV